MATRGSRVSTEIWQGTPEGKEIWIAAYMEDDHTIDRETAENGYQEWLEDATEEYAEFIESQGFVPVGRREREASRIRRKARRAEKRAKKLQKRI